LASEAPLFLDLAAFHAADVSLAYEQAVVKDVFGVLHSISKLAFMLCPETRNE
jgi:hypothetical protein